RGRVQHVPDAVVVEVVAVLEARGLVDGRGVALVAKGERQRAAGVLRAVVGERGRRRDVGDLHRVRQGRGTAVLVSDPAAHGVGAVVGEGVGDGGVGDVGQVPGAVVVEVVAVLEAGLHVDGRRVGLVDE